MTTGHGSFAASIFGDPAADPLTEAMRNAVLASAARIAEMTSTGFGTNVPFGNVHQPQYTGEDRTAFLLVSLGTGTTYFVSVISLDGDNLRAAVAIHQEGQSPKVENLRKMTLRRGEDGKVHATPGW